jgi:hypothetical protein
MTKLEFETEKQRIIDTLGQPVHGNGYETESNECQKQLDKLKGQYLASCRITKPRQPVLESKEDVVSSLGRLREITLVESDLVEFSVIEQELLKAYFANRSVNPKTLANRFNKSYQFVAGFLKSRAVLSLKAKYFHETLNENTQLALLKLTEDADPKIVLAAAEYLKILHDKESDTQGSKAIDDPVAEARLKQLGDELADL